MAGLRRHLICSIGRRSSSTSYRLGNRQETSSFAPAALARLLELTGARATILATRDDQVQQRAGELAAELQGAGLDTAIVDIPDGRDETEIYGIFDALVQAAPEDEEVILDVTFGLRHLPFIYLAALTYLSALRGVPIGGIYYGPFELPDTTTNTVDFVDLRPLLDLTNWYHAIQSANDSGDLRRIAGLVQAEKVRLFRGGQRDEALKKLANAANELAPALAAGLPVEAGIAATRLVEAISEARGAQGPQARKLAMERLEEWVQPLAIARADTSTPTAQYIEKQSVSLTVQELQRELNVARWYVQRNNVPAALAVLREWLVSLSLLRESNSPRWLSYGAARHAMEQRLNAQSSRIRLRKGAAPEAAMRLLAIWDSVRGSRNQFAHAGMDEKPVQVSDSGLAQQIDDCAWLLNADLSPLFAPPTGGTLLVSSQGTAKGLLFTALKRLATPPDALVVLVSAESRPIVPEALKQAGRPDLWETCTVLQMTEPATGYHEHQTLINDELRLRLAEASSAVVNLTGGTTVMQYIVGKISTAATKLGVRVSHIALIDKRSRAEQDASPWVAGELITIDETSSAEEASDAAT